MYYCSASSVEHSTNLFIADMEKFNFGYSVKNIPIPSEHEYKIQLTEKIEAVIRRMQWKATFFNEDQEDGFDQRTYGLKSSRTPPVVKELMAFEEDLWKLVTRLRFRRVNCEFQNKLKEDIKGTKTSKKVYFSADKGYHAKPQILKPRRVQS